MRIDKKILIGLAVLLPLVFSNTLIAGYELPKWFLWRWGMAFIFLAEVFRPPQAGAGKRGGRGAKDAPGLDKAGLPLFAYGWLAFFFFSLLSLGGAANVQLGLLNIANLILGFSLFWFVANRWDEADVKSLLPFLILPVLPVAVYGLCQAFGCDFVRLSGPFRGAVSSFGHRNFAAEYELMVLPLLLYGGFFGFNFSAPPRPGLDGLVRLFSLVSLPLVYAHFIMTHTRGSYAALMAALLFLLVFGAVLPRLRRDGRGAKDAPGNGRQAAGRSFVITTAVLLLLTGFFLWRNFSLPAGEKVIGSDSGAPVSAQNDAGKNAGNDLEIPSSLQSRLLIWKATLAVFRSHPAAGVGAGNLNEVIPPYYPAELRRSFRGKIEAGTSHNEYLQVLAETGVPGGISFFAFLVLLLVFGVKLSRRLAREKGERLPLCLTAGILGILAAGLVSSPLQRPVTLFLFYLFAACLAVFGRADIRRFEWDRKVSGRVAAGFLVLLAVSAYSFGWQAVCADFYGRKSLDAYRSGNRQQAVADIERAVGFQPQNRDLLNLAGSAYMGAGRFRESVRAYSQVIVYHPYWPQGYGNLGLVLAQGGFLADAEKYLKQSLRMDDYQPLVHNTLGTVYLQQGKRPEAKDEFLKALALDPSLTFPRLNLEELEKRTK